MRKIEQFLNNITGRTGSQQAITLFYAKIHAPSKLLQGKSIDEGVKLARKQSTRR